MNKLISEVISEQINIEKNISRKDKKDNGVFFTKEIKIIDKILDLINLDTGIFNKKILEPAVGNGIFLLRLIERVYNLYPEKEKIESFIENNLFFIDINYEMIQKTEKNISDLYRIIFNEVYNGHFNSFVYDFTNKVATNKLTIFNNRQINKDLESLLGKMDYVIGNPPYVTLYGRRDRKKNEEQRIKYLSQYKQFPSSVKNGKINYVMLFIEHGLDFLKKYGKLSFIIDVSFFETAYKYTRKYLLENTKILSIDTNISNFDGVASGQLILKLEKNTKNETNNVKVHNFITNEVQEVKQINWYNKADEYKFRFNLSDETKQIIRKVKQISPQRLKDLYPHKNLRTCTMLLNMEDKLVESKVNLKRNCKYYKYYQGSKGLYDKYCQLCYDKYFYFDKPLQDKINDRLKEELTKKGIKNKKRIGLGEAIIYDNPKIYIRQSAKEIIASYDNNPSAANNSLYVFTLRNNSEEAKKYLKFLCGYLNSELLTFYAQKMEIIRYRKGKYPQIKISDLYKIHVPQDKDLQISISKLVDKIYQNEKNKNKLEDEINKIVFNFYRLSIDDISFVRNSISNFLKS